MRRLISIHGPGLRLVLCFAIAFLVSLYSEMAFANDNSLDSITREFKTKTSQWESVLEEQALRLFWLLVMIDFLWMAISNVLKGGDFGDFIASITNQVFFIGIFYTLLVNSSDWNQAIVQSFRNIADLANAQAGGEQGISPSNIFDTGLGVAKRVIGEISFWSAGDSFGLVISSIIILISFALIAAYMTLVLVESYVVISAGVLMMGFGGSRWTKDYAMKILVYAVSVGAKLFVLQLIIGLGEAMINDWLVNFDANNEDVFVMIGSSIVMLALVKTIPEMVQGLINGASFSSGSAITSATAAAVGGAAGALAAGAGGGMAATSAVSLARAKMGAQDSPPASRLGRASHIMSSTVGNLAKAGLEDMGRAFNKQRGGTVGSRMSDTMKMKTEEIRAAATRPSTSSPSGNNVE